MIYTYNIILQLKKTAHFIVLFVKKKKISFSEDRIYNPPEILTIFLERGKGKKFKEKLNLEKN